MSPIANRSSDLASRGHWIAAAGWTIILLSAGAALLPLLDPGPAALVIGGLLVLAGLAEWFAGTLRHETRRLAMAAGAVTALAGVLFATDPATGFLPTLYIILGWLALRSLILFIASRLEKGSVKRWTLLSAATDLVLAVVLLVGLSIATLVVALFGPTPPMIASFAWFLALSFVVSGLLQLEVASCARAREDV